MADLLINPLIETINLKRTEPPRATGHSISGWFTKIYNISPFYDNAWSVDTYTTDKSNWETSLNYTGDLKWMLSYSSRSVLSVGSFNYRLIIRSKSFVKRLDGVSYSLSITDSGITYYNYNAALNLWSTEDVNNEFLTSFSYSEAKYNEYEYQTDIAAPPVTGRITLRIYAPTIDTNIDIFDPDFYLNEEIKNVYGTNKYVYTAFQVDTVSIFAVDQSIPKITSISTTPDNGESTGTATIVVDGGTAPFSYSVDGDIYQTSSIFDNLAADSYTAYVQDFNGLTASKDFVIESDILYKKSVFGSLGSLDDVYTFEIWEGNYDGDPRERNLVEGGMTFDVPKGNDFFSVQLKGSSCDLTILTNDGDNFTSLVSGSNRNAYIKINKNGSLFWFGWVLPAFFLEEYNSAPYTLTISGRDGLAEFNENYFDSLSEFGIEATGEVRIKDFICKLFSSISNENLYFDTSLYSVNSDGDDLEWFMHKINIDKYIENNDLISELLNNLFDSLRITVQQMCGDWYFLRLQSYNLSELSFSGYDNTGQYQGGKTIDPDFIVKKLKSTPTIQLQEPLKKITIVENYGKKDAANLNSEFEKWDNIGIGAWRCNSWTGIGAGEVFTGEEPSEVTLTILPGGGDVYLTQFIEGVESGGKMKFTTKVQLLGDLDTDIPDGVEGSEYEKVVIEMQIILNDGTTKYYFDASTGGWDAGTDERIQLINFSSESASEEGYKISDPMPAGGTIECRIYRNQYISYSVDSFIVELLDDSGNSYADINKSSTIINPKNRLTNDDYELFFGNVPDGYNNTLMYRGYLSNGETTNLKWSDAGEQISDSTIKDIYVNSIARKKSYPYRKFSGTVIGDMNVLSNVFVFDYNISTTETEKKDMYIGYVVTGFAFNPYDNEWNVELLEINRKIVTTEIETGEEELTPAPRLLIDNLGNYLKIDTFNKLKI